MVDFLYNLLVVLHFLGLASLIGGALVQMRTAGGERVINMAMLHGALTQVVSGLLLVAMQEMADSLDIDPNHGRIGVKLVVALVVTVLAWINRSRSSIPDGLYYLIFGLSVGNVIVAVFW
ncbi:hypothetical protein [Phytoactinopolyspora halotolerans]|uniref:Integral membrane protein n=1 Tax=Phytoactinopolyspora halotolerans TaxID=1981512 RepID=A0A6L9S392_9ACTN|nr:hypothetical protein [Phytoactinopolyspora halotolerans]NED99655.1 hypothetical protein [Phytoactinopolyspora halotolerans]